MTLADALAKLTGETDRLAAIQTTASTAEAALLVAEGRISELEAAALLVPSAEVVTAAELRATTAEAALATATAQIATLTASQSDFEVRVNAGIVSGIAAAGHAPVITKTGREGEVKNPGEGLTGLAKAIAIHKAESQIAK
jgi:hypothetical protein